MVVVNRFTKYVDFVSVSHPFTSLHVAKLFLNSICKFHGVPLSIEIKSSLVLYG